MLINKRVNVDLHNSELGGRTQKNSINKLYSEQTDRDFELQKVKQVTTHERHQQKWRIVIQRRNELSLP